jgi:hypothetical protein
MELKLAGGEGRSPRETEDPEWQVFQGREKYWLVAVKSIRSRETGSRPIMTAEMESINRALASVARRRKN